MCGLSFEAGRRAKRGSRTDDEEAELLDLCPAPRERAGLAGQEGPVDGLVGLVEGFTRVSASRVARARESRKVGQSGMVMATRGGCGGSRAWASDSSSAAQPVVWVLAMPVSGESCTPRNDTRIPSSRAPECARDHRLRANWDQCAPLGCRRRWCQSWQLAWLLEEREGGGDGERSPGCRRPEVAVASKLPSSSTPRRQGALLALDVHAGPRRPRPFPLLAPPPPAALETLLRSDQSLA